MLELLQWIAPQLAMAIVLMVVMGVLLEPFMLFPRPRIGRPRLQQMARWYKATEFDIETEDQTHLYGWRLGKGSPLVLFFSGNGSTVGASLERYQLLKNAGVTILQVNYRGYPGSQGRPFEKGLRQDARAAWAEARRTHAAKDIVLLGKSLGGGVAIGLAAELQARGETPRALVVESTFTSAVDVAAELIWWLPVRWFMRNRFNSLQFASQLQLPVLVIHGSRDEMIGVHHSHQLAEAIPEARQIVVDGGEHNDMLLADPAAWEAFCQVTQLLTTRHRGEHT